MIFTFLQTFMIMIYLAVVVVSKVFKGMHYCFKIREKVNNCYEDIHKRDCIFNYDSF